MFQSFPVEFLTAWLPDGVVILVLVVFSHLLIRPTAEERGRGR
jgi:hypothetical protein